MNVARKSTTKLPQNWRRPRPAKDDETDSGVGSADSADFQDPAKDNFQEALFNLKALNGGSEILPSEKSELKSSHRTHSGQKEDGNKNVSASPANQNGEEVEKVYDILDQIDGIVGEGKKSDVRNGSLTENAQGPSGTGNQSPENEDDDEVMVLDEDASIKDAQKSKEKNSKGQQRVGSKEGTADGISKESSSGTKKKHPLQIGAKVRSTVHSIMSKLVQSGGPEVNSLITKTKSEDSQDSISSTSGDRSPLPACVGKGNLFDNLDFDGSEKVCKSPKAALIKEDGDQAVPQKVKLPTKSEQDKAGLSQEGTKPKIEKDSSPGCASSKVDMIEPLQKHETTDTKDRKPVEEVEAENTCTSSTELESVNVPNKVESVEGVGSDEVGKRREDTEADKMGSTRTKTEDCAASGGDTESRGKGDGADVETELTDAHKLNCTSDTKGSNVEKGQELDENFSDNKLQPSAAGSAVDLGSESPTVSKCDDEKLDKVSSENTSEAGLVTNTGAEPMDTSEKSDTAKHDKSELSTVRTKAENSAKLTDSERKRQHEDGTDSDDSQYPKRSRLDEVIGKLGQRVSVPSEAEENDSFDYEDSIPGDSESAEKQSEEISEPASASDEEEDKASAASPNSKTLRLTNKELEALVRTKVKAYMAQQQMAELRNLRLRVVELQQAQEEWRQKAKDLERQVLDLTVLQQRLEKRKAHTAALRSITTRNFGVQVNEDKLRSTTPQKNAPSKSPAGVGPVTSPIGSAPTVMWPSGSQPLGQPLVAATTLSSIPPNSKVTTITIGGTLGTRNTSVAQLLSQTARMPTAASSVSSAPPSKATTSKPLTTISRMPAPTAIAVPKNSSLLETHVPKSLSAATAPPASSLVLVNAQSGLPINKSATATAISGSAIITASPGASNATSNIKYIDLTMEDDAAASKQSGKVAAPAAGQVRGMVPQQVVRQISPSQAIPGSTSTILLSSPSGTQIVGSPALPRPPGMYQVVTIANAQQLRPGSLVTVVPGQPSLVHPAAATSVTSTVPRAQAPQILAPVPPGMTIVRPAVGVGAPVRPASSQSAASTSRIPVTVTTLPSAAAPPQQESSATTTASRTIKAGHPAPPPPAVVRNVPGETKSVPPRPGLKISRVKQGIVLSWNMTLPSDCTEIASYQLYAYQETSAPPQTSLWKKVGDVKALPLPMACTLTQFQDGNKYHFAVRAVDIHGRTGPFSEPAFIFLSKSSS